MHLVEAWTRLAPWEWVRLLALPIAILVAALLPGRRVSRGAALVAAVAVTALDEMGAPPLVRAGWVGLWLLVAWQAGTPDATAVAGGRRRGALEAGMVALPLGLALLALMLAALTRQGFAPADARRAALGALVIGAGVLHLMLRRHARRALVAFASLGLGLELLGASARAADVLHVGPPAGSALAGALVVIALTTRIVAAREQHAGSPLVTDAHELHD